VTARILPEYEKIFDIAYPLKKLDTLVASDFDAGMCCLGSTFVWTNTDSLTRCHGELGVDHVRRLSQQFLVLLLLLTIFSRTRGRTAVYLYDEKRSGVAAKKLTTGVQSHEIAFVLFVFGSD
jgi:aminopeptidase 2